MIGINAVASPTERVLSLFIEGPAERFIESSSIAITVDGLKFWVLNKIVNPFVKLILRSPLHSMMSGGLILITYQGRRSKSQHTMSVQYARLDEEFIVVPGEYKRKHWWRNLRTQSPVTVRYRGRQLQASAMAIENNVEAIAHRLDAYFQRFPRSARYRDVPVGPTGEIDPVKLREVARDIVVVSIRLILTDRPSSPAALL